MDFDYFKINWSSTNHDVDKLRINWQYNLYDKVVFQFNDDNTTEGMIVDRGCTFILLENGFKPDAHYYKIMLGDGSIVVTIYGWIIKKV